MGEYDFSRVVNIGASGSVGRYIDFGIRPTKSELDILDPQAITKFVRTHAPRAIILLAGATDTRACERKPEDAYMRNSVAAYQVARAAEEADATLVYLSSSRIFSGEKNGPYSEEDVPDPCSVYGHSKNLGEIAVRTIASKHIIMRTAWVFGGGREHDTKFYGTVIRSLEAGHEVRALSDVSGSPTYAKDLIAAIKQKLVDGSVGTFHIANQGVASRLAIAQYLAQRLSSTSAVHPLSRSEVEGGNLLPTNESISSQTDGLRTWQEAMVEYLDREW